MFKYKIGKIRWIKAPEALRMIGISFDWDWYPSSLNIFLFKRQLKISFPLRRSKR